jgi:hypothetical protein
MTVPSRVNPASVDRPMSAAAASSVQASSWVLV